MDGDVQSLRGRWLHLLVSFFSSSLSSYFLLLLFLLFFLIDLLLFSEISAIKGLWKFIQNLLFLCSWIFNSATHLLKHSFNVFSSRTLCSLCYKPVTIPTAYWLLSLSRNLSSFKFTLSGTFHYTVLVFTWEKTHPSLSFSHAATSEQTTLNQLQSLFLSLSVMLN